MTRMVKSASAPRSLSKGPARAAPQPRSAVIVGSAFGDNPIQSIFYFFLIPPQKQPLVFIVRERIYSAAVVSLLHQETAAPALTIEQGSNVEP
jgi:hypothetical protein